MVHEERVRVAYLARQAHAEGQAHNFGKLLANFGDESWLWKRPHPRIVVNDLLFRVSVQNLNESNHVCVAGAELVVRSVKTKRDVLRFNRSEGDCLPQGFFPESLDL